MAVPRAHVVSILNQCRTEIELLLVNFKSISQGTIRAQLDPLSSPTLLEDSH